MKRLAVSNGHWAMSHRMHASEPFKRFNPEVHQAVRRPDVTGQSYAEQVKRARQMLRSMDPEIVKQVIEFHKDLNLFQALELAKREGKLIVPNYVHDGILSKTDDRVFLEQNYPVWTGALVIYEKPDKPFGNKVNFGWKNNGLNYSISFHVPKRFRGKTNCALIVEHPDFEIKTVGENEYELKSVDGANIRLIENFSKRDGWYMPDAETKIPHGKKVEEHPDSRYLWRLDSDYIGLLGRVHLDFLIYGRNGVVLIDLPSDRRGVALVPLAVTEK